MEFERYKVTNYAIFFTVFAAVLLSYVFKWSYTDQPINFMGGDSSDFYSTLVATFITHDLAHQTANEWYLLKTSSGIINVHPIGVSVLLLPFFLLALVCASLFGFAADGYSLPFQLAVAAGALFYATLGLLFIKKLFQLNKFSDKNTALLILLIFFGTNLLHYTLSEAGMSHVYSFGLISGFIYFSNKFVLLRKNTDLLLSALILGLIVLVRPYNIFIVLSVFMFFKSFSEATHFLKDLLRNNYFYLSLFIATVIVLLQSLVWYIQTETFFHNTYQRDGFYWMNPQILKMLFGFNSGFFIYTPLCFLLIFGLATVYRRNRFSFYASLSLVLFLFYFFASYWGYTYFDGFGIRVLVDYYSLFAFFGVQLFENLSGRVMAFSTVASTAIVLLAINLVYSYQANRGILLRAGMNFEKWKYVFMRTDPKYRDCLGGSNELHPFSKELKSVALKEEIELAAAFDFSGQEYGPTISFRGLGFDSNRISLELACRRKEVYANASEKTLMCLAIQDPVTKTNKAYTQFKLNETPARNCCESREYHYTANLVGDFKSGDELSVYIWNMEKKPFLLEKLAVEVYDYKYHIN